VCLIGFSSALRAQGSDDGWNVAVYPIFAWVPIDIGIEVDIPPVEGGGGGLGEIVESRFDGAFFGGVTAANGPWWIEGYGLWMAFGGDRFERPFLVADLDVIYGDAKVGRRIAPDLYVTGGLRRVALKYDVTLGDLPRFSNEPGVWDPVVGVGWHRQGSKVEWHASFDGGGFGVGSDVDLGAAFRVDWKFARHIGLAAGYNFLYLKLSDEVANRTVTVKPTVHGPAAGFGLYF
jgi:hypothetical protein